MVSKPEYHHLINIRGFHRVYKYQEPLETERLRTRKLTEDDILIWSEFFSDKEAVEFIPFDDASSNTKRAKNWIDKQLSRYTTNRLGLQALIHKNTNQLLGQCGLLLQNVDGKKEIEVSYHILKKYWGNGYAPEAAKRFIDYAFENNLTTSVISIIHTDNIRSLRVAKKNGLKREKKTVWAELDVYIYRIIKEDWNQKMS